MFFKRIGSLCFFGLLISCSDEKIETAIKEITKPVYDTLAIGSKVYNMQTLADTNFTFEKMEFEGETDSIQITKYKNVSRSRDTLFLKCDNGKVVRLVNNLNEEDYIVYDFRYFNTDINAFVVSCSFYEAGAVLLVNNATGDSLETIGLPVVAPGKKQFVCYNLDLEAAFTTNGFELYEYTNNKYISRGLRELNNWGPEKVMWKDDTTLVIRATTGYADSSKVSYKAIYIK